MKGQQKKQVYFYYQLQFFKKIMQTKENNSFSVSFT